MQGRSALSPSRDFSARIVHLEQRPLQRRLGFGFPVALVVSNDVSA